MLQMFIIISPKDLLFFLMKKAKSKLISLEKEQSNNLLKIILKVMIMLFVIQLDGFQQHVHATAKPCSKTQQLFEQLQLKSRKFI